MVYTKHPVKFLCDAYIYWLNFSRCYNTLQFHFSLSNISSWLVNCNCKSLKTQVYSLPFTPTQNTFFKFVYIWILVLNFLLIQHTKAFLHWWLTFNGHNSIIPPLIKRPLFHILNYRHSEKCQMGLLLYILSIFPSILQKTTTITMYCIRYRVSTYYKPANQLEQEGFPYELLLDKSHSGVELHDTTQMLHFPEKQKYLCTAFLQK
jgi:hypothetical protein